MGGTSDDKTTGDDAKTAREARLKAALKANLGRRKAQAKARDADRGAGGGAGGGDDLSADGGDED